MVLNKYGEIIGVEKKSLDVVVDGFIKRISPEDVVPNTEPIELTDVQIAPTQASPTHELKVGGTAILLDQIEKIEDEVKVKLKLSWYEVKVEVQFKLKVFFHYFIIYILSVFLFWSL